MTVLTKYLLLGALALSAVNAQDASADSSSAADATPTASGSDSASASSGSDAAATPVAGGGNTSGFQFKETYPPDSAKPTPKPEWMQIIANANITNAPVQKANGDAGKVPAFNVLFCLLCIIDDGEIILQNGPFFPLINNLQNLLLLFICCNRTSTTR